MTSRRFACLVCAALHLRRVVVAGATTLNLVRRKHFDIRPSMSETDLDPSLPASFSGSGGERQGYPSALRGLDPRRALPRNGQLWERRWTSDGPLDAGDRAYQRERKGLGNETDLPSSLTVTSAPLAHDLDVVGDIKLQLDAVSTAVER
jgi:hypothetical protein